MAQFYKNILKLVACDIRPSKDFRTWTISGRSLANLAIQDLAVLTNIQKMSGLSRPARGSFITSTLELSTSSNKSFFNSNETRCFYKCTISNQQFGILTRNFLGLLSS